MLLLESRHAMAGVKGQGIGVLTQLLKGLRLFQAGVTQIRHNGRGRRAPSCPSTLLPVLTQALATAA